MISDDERAAIEQRATQGDVAAQIYLGWAYSEHGPFAHDSTLAEHWYRLAARSKQTEALRRLARFLYDRQSEEARSWAEILVKQNDFYGYYLMGHMLLHGDCGVKRDRSAGLRNLEISAMQGHLVSKLDLLKHGTHYYFLGPVSVLRIAAVMAKIFYTLLRSPGSMAVYR